MPPGKYGISAGVLLPACTLCCSVSSHPTSTLMGRAGIIRWAVCEMRVAPRQCTTEPVGRAVFGSRCRQPRASERRRKQCHPSDQMIWARSNHRQQCRVFRVAHWQDREWPCFRGETQKAAPRAQQAGCSRIEGCRSVQGLKRGGVARRDEVHDAHGHDIHDVSRHRNKADGLPDSVFIYCLVQTRGDQPREVPQRAWTQ